MRFVKDTFTVFVSHVTSVLLGVIATVVIARVLGATGNGIYALVILVPTFLTLVGNMGIGSANLYYGAKKKYECSELASNSLLAALVLGVLLLFIFLTYYFVSRPSFLGEVEPLHVVIGVSTLPFSLVTMYFASLLLGQRKIGHYNLLQIAPRIISLAVMLILLLVFSAGMLGAVLAWALGVVTTSLVAVTLVLKVARIHAEFHPRAFADSVRYGVQSYLANAIQFMNYRADILMLAYLTTARYVGYYSVSVALAEALWYFPAAVGTNIVARTAGGTAEDANRTTPRVCRTTLFITLLIALSLLGLSRFVIVWFYGSDFLPAVRALWYLLPGVVSLSICKVLSNELAGRGKPGINAIVSVLSLVINVPLNLLLIPRMGIDGAALASTVSYSVAALATLVAFVRVSGQGWFDTIMIRPEDVRLCAGLLVSLLVRIRTAAVGLRG